MAQADKHLLSALQPAEVLLSRTVVHLWLQKNYNLVIFFFTLYFSAAEYSSQLLLWSCIMLQTLNDSRFELVSAPSTEIGDIAGVADVTIRQSYRLIYPRAAELFPPDFKFDTPVDKLPQLWRPHSLHSDDIFLLYLQDCIFLFLNHIFVGFGRFLLSSRLQAFVKALSQELNGHIPVLK